MPPPANTPPPLEFVYRLSRKRFAVPTILVVAVLALVFNELRYQNTVSALQTADALTEARIAAADVLQLVTDAETGQRGYLLTGRAEYLAPLTAAKAEVPRMRATLAAFLDASAPAGPEAARRMAQDLDATLADIEESLRLERAGDHQAALHIVAAGSGRQRMEDMRGIFATSLAEAAQRQHQARVSIDRALRINRVAVALLTLLGALGLCFYVRHLRRGDAWQATRHEGMEAQVSARNEELHELAGYLVTAREDEKAHLARELHDELGAVLTAAKFDVARLRKLALGAAGADRLNERLAALDLCLNEGIALKRRIVEDLRPSALALLGLTISLSNLCRDVGSRLAIPVFTHLEDVPLSADGELAIYRLVQEALTNVGKYAHATQVSIYVNGEGPNVRVRIEDDGVGFDTTVSKSATHGIAGMRFRLERLSGGLTVESRPGAGTRLHAWLPASPPAAQAAALAA